LNIDNAGELELECVLRWPMASRAASWASDDKTFSVAILFSDEWLFTIGWECKNFLSKNIQQLYITNNTIIKSNNK
jgi:hypothetical protein